MATGGAPAREAYAHDAVLELDPDGDDCAPGAAITLALCGRWAHDPPCPLAPHHTRVDRAGAELTLRVLFAADPADAPSVRRLIDRALETGWGDDPAGGRTTWRLIWSGPAPLREDESAHARRLTRS